MVYLVAHHFSEKWSGEIARETFDNLEDAFIEMQKWANHGVDAYCNEAQHIGIFNKDGLECYRWDWSKKKAIEVECIT